MLVLFFLFCEGKTEENLEHIFNLFDADGNKVRVNNLYIYLRLYIV